MASAARSKQTSKAAPSALVIGPVPALTRVAGGVAAAAGLLLVVGLFLPYVVVGGQSISPPHAPVDLVVALVWPALIGVAGAYTARGRLPRLGLAVIGGAGTIGVGVLLQQLYQFVDASRHTALEVFLGQPHLTSSIAPKVGLYVAVSADALLVLALVLTVLAWPRTVMEDRGDFEAARPLVTGVGAVVGFVAALSLAALAVDIPDRIVSGPSGFQTVVQVAKPVGLLDQVGLDQLGGVLLCVGVLAVTLVGPSLRPRLATVGSFAVLTAYFVSTGLGTLLAAVHSDVLVLGLGGGLQVLSAALFGGLTWWSATVRGDTRGVDRLRAESESR